MLRVEGLHVRFGDREVLRGVDLVVPAGQLVAVLGRSGSGKTTLLRVICGLERPDAGRVVWMDRDLTGVPIHERGVGLMFQDDALFPHRDVGANVGFGLRMDRSGRWPDPGARGARVAEVLGLVGLEGAQRRSVSSLSGGEQQRVALARALAPAPKLLLLDEPMGSLDRGLRARLLFELRTIFGTLGITVLYVTHDQEEAMGIADRVVLLHDGRIEADGAPEALWRRPPSVVAARFLGFTNVTQAEIGAGLAATPWGEVPAPSGAGDGTAWILLRPDGFEPDPGGPIRGEVTARVFQGDHVRLRVAVDAAPPLEVHARWAAIPAVGDRVAMRVAADGVQALARA